MYTITSSIISHLLCIQSHLQLSLIYYVYNQQLTVQSMPITTEIVSSNPAYEEVYSLQHRVINFVSDMQQVGSFLRVLWFPPPIKLTVTIYLKYC
jgi:hypothetical protein